MRLIDADLLKENISKWLKPSKPDETEMIEVADALVSTMMEIDEQPTAFDVDKVIEKWKTEGLISIANHVNIILMMKNQYATKIVWMHLLMD